MNNSLQSGGLNSAKIKSFFVSYALYILILFLFALYNWLTPLFLSAQNIQSLFTNSSALLVAACGMMFVLLIGEIDLSIGSIAGVSAAVWIALITNWSVPVIGAFFIAIVCAVIMGAFNAFLIYRLNISSFLATLGMQIFWRGFVYIMTDGAQILMTTEIKELNSTLKEFFGGFSPLLVFSVLLCLLGMVLFRYTAFGRKLQAVGCNRVAAKNVGVNVKWTSTYVYMLCAMFAGIAGIFQCTNVGMVNPSNVGNGLEFLAITACVLGGASLAGGVGTVFPGALIGVIFLNSIENGLGLLGANAYIYPVVRGAVIYLAMVSDSLKRATSTRK